jgi:hypothetical protein
MDTTSMVISALIDLILKLFPQTMLSSNPSMFDIKHIIDTLKLEDVPPYGNE